MFLTLLQSLHGAPGLFFFCVLLWGAAGFLDRGIVHQTDAWEGLSIVVGYFFQNNTTNAAKTCIEDQGLSQASQDLKS